MKKNTEFFKFKDEDEAKTIDGILDEDESCEYCGAEYQNYGSLRSHIYRKHTKAKPEGQNSTIPALQNAEIPPQLINISKICGKAPNQCKYCGYQSANRLTLKSHTYRKHNSAITIRFDIYHDRPLNVDESDDIVDIDDESGNDLDMENDTGNEDSDVDLGNETENGIYIYIYVVESHFQPAICETHLRYTRRRFLQSSIRYLIGPAPKFLAFHLQWLAEGADMKTQPWAEAEFPKHFRQLKR